MVELLGRPDKGFHGEIRSRNAFESGSKSTSTYLVDPLSETILLKSPFSPFDTSKKKRLL